MDMFALFFAYMLPCLVIGTMAAFVIKDAFDTHRRRTRAKAKRELAQKQAVIRAANERRRSARTLYVCTLDAGDTRCA